jgi:SagB-type dehydrogenase family enzyme
MHPLLAYHERTKHSFHSVRSEGHRLDWANEPSRFKRYLDLEPAPLPAPEPTGVPWHRAVEASAEGAGGGRLDAGRLSHILFHAAGVLRAVRGPGGTFHFRTYAAAGALYPVEAYVVAGEVEGLAAGVYHYDPREHALARLRDGDLRGNLGLADRSHGAASVVLSGIPWRTAWKYGPRGFRHLYWDAGMIVANLLAAAGANEIRTDAMLGFVDREVSALVGLDGRTEFALCLIGLGEGDAPEPNPVPGLAPRVGPISPRPMDDPVIADARAAVVLADQDAVRSFRAGRPPRGRPVQASSDTALSGDPIEEVIRRRGSSRHFAREAFPASEYDAIAALALAGFTRDWGGGPCRALVVANALQDLDPGAYAVGPPFRSLRGGDLREQAGYLCLEQRLGADAAAVTFLMADLSEDLETLGGRGYAAAQLEAAVAAGRLYLGAYGQCLGATGTTFYDDEVRSFFGTPWEPMMAVAMGPEGRRASIRRCRRALEGAGARPPA